jgi:hypothetical protein
MLAAAVVLTAFTGGTTSFSAKFAGFVASQAASIAAAGVVNFVMGLVADVLVGQLLQGLPIFDRVRTYVSPCDAVGYNAHGNRYWTIVPS